MRYRLFSYLSILSVAACVACAQGMISTSAGPAGFSYTVSTNRFNGTPVTGAPYSAEQVSEHVQVLADGTRITQDRTPNATKMYRDSQGRTRTERKMFRNDGVTAIEINDPVAGVGYALDEDAKVAHKFTLRQRQPTVSANTMPAAGGGGGQAIPANRMGLSAAVPTVLAPVGETSGVPRPRHETESLGTDTIEGVMVKGTRMTTTYPVGSVGNDREFSSYSENWFSPDLRLTILSKNVDPRNGESTTRMTNLSRDEPDPSLFQPPAGYSVVEETGSSFTIHSERQQ